MEQMLQEEFLKIKLGKFVTEQKHSSVHKVLKCPGEPENCSELKQNGVEAILLSLYD